MWTERVFLKNSLFSHKMRKISGNLKCGLFDLKGLNQEEFKLGAANQWGEEKSTISFDLPVETDEIGLLIANLRLVPNLFVA